MVSTLYLHDVTVLGCLVDTPWTPHYLAQLGVAWALPESREQSCHMLAPPELKPSRHKPTVARWCCTGAGGARKSLARKISPHSKKTVRVFGEV